MGEEDRLLYLFSKWIPHKSPNCPMPRLPLLWVVMLTRVGEGKDIRRGRLRSSYLARLSAFQATHRSTSEVWSFPRAMHRSVKSQGTKFQVLAKTEYPRGKEIFLLQVSIKITNGLMSPKRKSSIHLWYGVPRPGRPTLSSQRSATP